MKMARLSLIAALAVLLPLAACHKTPEPAPEPDANVVEDVPAPEPENNMMEVAPPPVVKPAEPKKPVKPWPTVSADQQMLDDADATGMTARVSRDGDSDGSNSQ